MMSETALMYQGVGALLGLVMACFFYSLGGRSGKWKRRFIASFILSLTVNVLSLIRGVWNPWLIATFPCLIVGFSLGYSADTFGAKILRRALYALAVISAGGICAFIFGGNAWWVLVAHGVFGTASIFLGVKNPLPAAVEEIFICALLNLFLVAYPFTAGA